MATRTALERSGFTLDGPNNGVAGYVFPSSVTGSTELYRLRWPSNPPQHLWTISSTEYNTLLADNWVDESPACYVFAT